MPFRYSRGELENEHAIFGFGKRACGLRVESPETVIQESWEATKCSAPGRDGTQIGVRIGSIDGFCGPLDTNSHPATTL
jgi:hypothetical protein